MGKPASAVGALVVLALLRSADYCASELVTQVNLVTVSLGLVVFHAANGVCERLGKIVKHSTSEKI